MVQLWLPARERAELAEPGEGRQLEWGHGAGCGNAGFSVPVSWFLMLCFFLCCEEFHPRREVFHTSDRDY